MCTKYDRHSKFGSMSQNTGLFFPVCSPYSTKKCCRWIFIAPAFSSDMRNSTLRALPFVSKGSDLVFTEKQLLIWVCLLLCSLPMVLSQGALCLKWAFIKELTGISVASNKSLSTVSIRLTSEVSLKKPDLKDL